MQELTLAAFPVLFLLGAGVFRAYNKLVELEHTDWREYWERDGRPRGSGRSRVEGDRWTGSHLMFRWMVTSPDWAFGNKTAERWLSRMRWFAFAYLLLFGALLITGLVWSARHAA